MRNNIPLVAGEEWSWGGWPHAPWSFCCTKLFCFFVFCDLSSLHFLKYHASKGGLIAFRVNFVEFLSSVKFPEILFNGSDSRPNSVEAYTLLYNGLLSTTTSSTWAGNSLYTLVSGHSSILLNYVDTEYQIRNSPRRNKMIRSRPE